MVDSSALCRGEPVVGRQGQLNVQLIKGTRDLKGRMCKVQLGFYSVKDPSYPYLSTGEEQLETSTGKVKNHKILSNRVKCTSVTATCAYELSTMLVLTYGRVKFH